MSYYMVVAVTNSGLYVLLKSFDYLTPPFHIKQSVS